MTMSRSSSPPPLSDDSAVGSIASSMTNSINRQASSKVYGKENSNQKKPPEQTNGTIEISKQGEGLKLIREDELTMAATRMRYNNTHLTSRSIRTHLSCFDDLDVERFEAQPDSLISFRSIGVNKCPSLIQRPVSILWPDSYDKMVSELAKLDALLINTEFKEKPIDWMLKRGLTSVPKCRECKGEMILKFNKENVRWHCLKTQACLNLYAPIQRPSFFREYENVGLIKILFAIYFWSTCTQGNLLYNQMNLEPQVLHGIWKCIQNVCRTALEKSYPRFRLCNNPEESSADQSGLIEPIDLISTKVNNIYVVCAKHPRSNCVRLGLCIPRVSQYSFVELTESWFAHGAQIRVCESKFLDLTKKRSDLKVQLVPRIQMVSKDGSFNRDSAFGYLVCQLTHTFKDFDSSAVTRESMKLILAETQWRELYGTNPHDAFTNIIKHIAQFGEASESYSEPSTADGQIAASDVESQEESEHVYAEKYFYATVEPIDNNGNVNLTFGKPDNLENPPQTVVEFLCHICNNRYESFDFSMHIIAHVENNRKENERIEYLKRKMIQCKHCFKPHKRDTIKTHSELLKLHLHTIKFGCRICCIKFGDRSKYLEHMRRSHFEHETPYRCPTCPFATSFQRELFIHHQEEHRHAFVVLCPFCLRSFSLSTTASLDIDHMRKASQMIYNHILQHYVVANTYNCSNCCLSFLCKEKRRKHKVAHHNPLEIRPEREVKVQPFIVTQTEQAYCVPALPMELFIANKRPNLEIDEASQAAGTVARDLGSDGCLGQDPQPSTSATTRLKPSDSNNFKSNPRNTDTDDDSSDETSETESFATAPDEDTIHVRDTARNFLAGGRPAIHITTKRSNAIELTSEKILFYMSKMKRADGIVANRSVILTPGGWPAKCVECLEYISADHYVAAINCRHCKYTTHCPRAATNHLALKHPRLDNE